MHKRMVNKIINAPVNLFFDVTPVGTIVNRIRNIDTLEWHYKGCINWLLESIIFVG